MATNRKTKCQTRAAALPLSTNGVNKKDRNNKMCGERALPTSTNMLIYKMGWPSRLQFLAPFHISCNPDNNKVGNRSYMHSFLKVTIRENTTEHQQLLFFHQVKGLLSSTGHSGWSRSKPEKGSCQSGPRHAYQGLGGHTNQSSSLPGKQWLLLWNVGEEVQRKGD